MQIHLNCKLQKSTAIKYFNVENVGSLGTYYYTYVYIKYNIFVQQLLLY